MQKFNEGDHVMIAKDLGTAMSHFTSDCEAIVIRSYKDQYGGNNDKSYTLYIKDQGRVSWYEEHQLTLIEANRHDLLQQWEDEALKATEQQSDLDWIFAHGTEILESASGSTLSALALCLGVTDLWGNRGEGFVYHMNAQKILMMARRYLIAGDKDGWLKWCESVKKWS